jgi:hypothetical protein
MGHRSEVDWLISQQWLDLPVILTSCSGIARVTTTSSRPHKRHGRCPERCGLAKSSPPENVTPARSDWPDLGDDGLGIDEKATGKVMRLGL